MDLVLHTTHAQYKHVANVCTRNNQALSESVFTKVQTSRFPQISWLSYCVTFSRNAVHDELGDAWHWAVKRLCLLQGAYVQRAA